MRAETIAERVWPGQPVEVEPLGGGITNHNFKVVVAGEAFVLRIGGERTELLGIDRGAEHAAALIAAELGVGPNVVAFVEPEGSLVTEFIEGEPVPADEMRRPETLREVAGLLRRVHEGPPFPRASTRSAWSSATARPPRRTAWSRPPRTAGQAHRRPDRAAPRPPPARALPQRPAERELHSFTRPGIRIVDWEYAGMGDRFFDLANFAVNHGWTPTATGAARRYSAAERRGDRASPAHALHVRLPRGDVGRRAARCPGLDFDFEGYARQHFERLERTAGDPDFQEALA